MPRIARAGALVLAVGALALVRFATWPAESRAASPARASGAPAVVVELFSSEGCSSCPPADAFVAALDRAQPVEGATVLALEEHVTYWDDLGWRDPFGSEAHDARQRDYARVLADHSVFTPEVVIDGRFIMPTGNEGAARRMIAEAARDAKAHVTLRREGDRLAIDVTDAPAESADAWLALTESDLATRVTRGENAGRRLAHAPVVRALRRVGHVDGGKLRTETTLERDASWNAGAMRVVVFVQLAASRRIVGAAAIAR